MTAALGLGTAVAVAEVEFAPIGTGQMADSFRFELDYGSHPRDNRAPRNVIVKMQAADELSRQAGASGAYASEVNFYKHLAATLSVRTPRCYYADGPDEDGRFALVLEDLAPAEQGDQIAGCSLEQARSAVLNLAGLHGPRWCDPTLLDTPWLRRARQSAELFQSTIRDRTERFIEHYGAEVPEADAVVLRAFAAGCGFWLRGRSERFAPLHGDYRLDNLLFGAGPDQAQVAAVDWQTLEVGLPGRDLGYFLGNSLLPEARRRNEQGLVAAYHQALLSHGVRGYSREECWEDYRYGQFQGPMITVLAAVGLTHTQRGDDMFLAMSSRACQAIRDLDSVALI